jgi:hypothetical protein
MYIIRHPADAAGYSPLEVTYKAASTPVTSKATSTRTRDFYQ